MSEKEVVLGAAVELVQEEPGVYKAAQIDRPHGLPPVDDGQGRKGIDWSFGPIKVVGYLDVDRYELGVAVSVMGISLGNIYGSLKDGVGVDFNLALAVGALKFYLKNGNELWVHLDVKIKFDGSYEGDYKMMSF